MPGLRQLKTRQDTFSCCSHSAGGYRQGREEEGEEEGEEEVADQGILEWGAWFPLKASRGDSHLGTRPSPQLTAQVVELSDLG